MALIWKAPIRKTVSLLNESGKRELFWYGVTIGQIGFGVLASEKRQPTKRAVDLLSCPQCEGDLHNGYCQKCKAVFEPTNQ